MRRWMIWMVMASALVWLTPAQAGGFNWSLGYSDYGRHGGYTLEVGRYGGQRYNALSWSAPAWYGPSWGYGYGNGYRDDRWYLSGYRSGYSYGGCRYGCAYGYTPRYYGYRAPSYGYRYERRHYDRDDRRDRYDRHDRYGNYGYRDRGYVRYERDRYDHRSRSGRYNESAYERAREHAYDAHDDAWRGQRGRDSAW